MTMEYQYVSLDENNIVTHVCSSPDEMTLVDGVEIPTDVYYSSLLGCRIVKGDENMFGGVHSQGSTPFRKNAAGVGFKYDEQRDAFIPPQPFPSWTLNEDSCQWDAPTPYPLDDTKTYRWDENTLDWITG